MINNRQGDSLETTNSGINHCSLHLKKKAYRSGTEGLELDFDSFNTSHNICYIKSNCLSRLLQKPNVSKTSGKLGKSISLNTFDQADILKVYVQSFKSYYKDLYNND